MLPIIMMVTVAFAFSSCDLFDLDVDNPDDIEDVELDVPENIPSIVAGVHGDFAFMMTQPGGGGIITNGALLTDELVHVGTWVGMRGLSNGWTEDDWVEAQSRWAEPSSARWTAEEMLPRVRDLVEEDDRNPDSSPEVAEIAMWAGHANRVMGDTFPIAVIDGGGPENLTEYYRNAINYFEEAIEVAQAADREDLESSARGGLAQSLVMLAAYEDNDQHWDDALNHASQVETDFVFEQEHSLNSSREENNLRWWGYRRDETGVWGTPFQEWGQKLDDTDGSVVEDGDPRVQWTIRPDEEVGGDGTRPFKPILKYESEADNVTVVKGTEMRLLEAEYELLQGNYDEVVAKIDEIRAHHGLDEVEEDINNTNDAWELLMKESGIELWLEGRRLPNFRRWIEISTHPDVIPFEVVRIDDENPQNVIEDVDGFFLRVSREEKESNPNLETRDYSPKF